MSLICFFMLRVFCKILYVASVLPSKYNCVFTNGVDRWSLPQSFQIETVKLSIKNITKTDQIIQLLTLFEAQKYRTGFGNYCFLLNICDL